MSDQLSLISLPLFALVWVVVGRVVAAMGGWNRLAKVYPAHSNVSGEVFRFCSARMRNGTAYNNSLTCTVGPNGLRLSLLLPFFSHRPIFIPWREITAERLPKAWFWHVRLRFQNCPNVTLDFHLRLAKKLEQGSGYQFQIR